MRKLLFVFCVAAMIAACGEGKNRSGMNSDENTEDNSGEVASPALEDSASMNADTVSAPGLDQRQEMGDTTRNE
jgi:hypothetical protein